MARLAGTVIKQGVKAGIKVDVEELKRHIHRELFGDRFPTAPSVAEWKEQRKQAVMQHSVKIMLRHEQSEKDILRMLEDKFFLTEEQAQEFMKKTSPVKKEQRR
ncbi:MAG: hypothetical protein NC305_16055 [Lachnospiraceae bacterium]|nr:hypothetical protein [Butyrivibrio sp.]MCM1412041.1 hypothetical protein [Lachnospiraceae bacterium]